MKKKTSETLATQPVTAPREIGDDERVQIPVTRKELAVLFNAVRALELLHTVEKDSDDDMKLITFAVLLDTTLDPAWNAISDLQDRYRDAELRAAGHGKELDQLESKLNAS